MSDISGVLVFVLGFAGCVVVLARFVATPIPDKPRETLADRWRKMTEELPK